MKMDKMLSLKSWKQGMLRKLWNLVEKAVIGLCFGNKKHQLTYYRSFILMKVSKFCYNFSIHQNQGLVSVSGIGIRYRVSRAFLGIGFGYPIP